MISEAQAPIDALDGEHRQMQIESSAKIAQAQSSLQELNMSVDKLNVTNKGVERYVRSYQDGFVALNESVAMSKINVLAS